MGNITINIATDFSRTPGPRYIEEGEFSAQFFLEKLLLEKFEEVVSTKSKLVIVLDGTAGFATSFLEGSFGELQRIYNSKGIRISNYLEFVSNEEPYLKDEILEYIEEAL